MKFTIDILVLVKVSFGKIVEQNDILNFIINNQSIVFILKLRFLLNYFLNIKYKLFTSFYL